MKKFKVDTLNINPFIVVVRLIEIIEIGPEDFKSILTNDGCPEFIGIERNSLNYQNFENIRVNNQVIMLDLDKVFSDQKKNITDDNINRQIKLYIPSSQNINLKIDNDLSDFFNRENKLNSPDYFHKECPHCEDVFLEKYETCEFCGYTRY